MASGQQHCCPLLFSIIANNYSSTIATTNHKSLWHHKTSYDIQTRVASMLPFSLCSYACNRCLVRKHCLATLPMLRQVTNLRDIIWLPMTYMAQGSIVTTFQSRYASAFLHKKALPNHSYVTCYHTTTKQLHTASITRLVMMWAWGNMNVAKQSS